MKSTIPLLAALLLGPTLLLCQSNADNQPAAVPKTSKMLDLDAIDRSVDPCVNFYQFACGNWRKTNTIPPERSEWGRFDMLAERSRWLTYRALEQASHASASRTPLQQKYGDFFAACMNTSELNSMGYTPIRPLLNLISELSHRSQISLIIANLQSEKGIKVLFRFESAQDAKNSQEQIAELSQRGLGLPERSFYLNDDDRSTKIRESYVTHVKNMFALIGDSPVEAAAEANRVLAFETGLAKASLPRQDITNPGKTYHRLSLAQLEQLSPDYGWTRFFSSAGAPKLSDNINVAEPEFFQYVSSAVREVDLATWRSYLRWSVVNSSAPWLSDVFVNEHFSFYGKLLSGQDSQEARWQKCTTLTDDLLGEAVGQDWVKQNFVPASRVQMQALVASIENALSEDIRELDWMSPTTKAEAEAKVAAMRNKIGYPDRWRDYSSVITSRHYLIDDIQRASAFEYHRKLLKIGKPVDDTEWDMTPQTVNAYYDASKNEIDFPAGILQPPFFNPNANAAQNLGGIGIVIGHEITHGFDDVGGKYDAHGNVREWYTERDRKAFEERTSCEVKEYDNFEPVPGQKLNGSLTLGENTADNGALRLGYIALLNTLKHNPNAAQTVDGYTPAQQYFISFGQILCENRTDARSRLDAKTDPHSPGEFRVNGVVQNFDQFGKTFGCKVGDPMMPKTSCRVW